jgi:hypothetical protein
VEAWIWLNMWTADPPDILGVFDSEEGANAAWGKCAHAPLKANSSIMGPFPVQGNKPA